MLRGLPMQLRLLGRRPAPGQPAPTIAAVWINSSLGRDFSSRKPPPASAPSYRYGMTDKYKAPGLTDFSDGKSGMTLRPPGGDKGSGRQCKDACPKPKKDPCKTCRTPPCRGRTSRKILWGLLAAIAGLAGLYYFGWLDPILEMLGLGGTSGFPGLGKPRIRHARHHHPSSSVDLPNDVNYLVVGGGSAGISAARAIRSLDRSARVLIIGAENAFPYQRTPLSKELWQGGAGACFVAGDGTLRSVFYEPESFYVDCKAMANGSRGVAVARGWEVDHLNLKEHKAILNDGYSIKYEKCVLATGTSPYQLRVFDRAKQGLKQKVLLLHDVCDFEGLRAALRGGARDIVIVGSCSEACELAAALARYGRDVHIPGLRVTLVYPDETPNAKVLPMYLGKFLARCLEHEGVRCVPKAKVRGIKEGDHAELRLSTGDRMPACRVVVLAATAPNTGLAGRSGIPLDGKLGGFKADGKLFAADDVWAAGDCVSFCSPVHGRTRWEGLDHALASGRLAGQNMVAAKKGNVPQCYNYMPVRWASLCPGSSYEAVGEVDASLTTVGVFSPGPPPDSEETEGEVMAHSSCKKEKETGSGSGSGSGNSVDYSRGVVFYLRDNTVVGVLMWNLPRRISTARCIIENQTQYDQLDDAVRQLCIHS